MPSPAQLRVYSINSNRLTKAWQIARHLARGGVAHHPDLARAGYDFRTRVVREARVNPRALSEHTWKLAVSIARRIK